MPKNAYLNREDRYLINSIKKKKAKKNDRIAYTYEEYLEMINLNLKENTEKWV